MPEHYLRNNVDMERFACDDTRLVQMSLRTSLDMLKSPAPDIFANGECA
jgi:hypothetical protein